MAARDIAKRWRRCSQSGVAAVEFAMIAPILLVLIFGVLEIGCLFFAQYILKNAAIATARNIRTGNGTALQSSAALTDYICNTEDSTIDKLAANIMLSSCTDATKGIKIYMKTMGTGFSYDTLATAMSASKIQSSGTVPVNWDTTTASTCMSDPTKTSCLAVTDGACQVVFLRVSYAWNVIVPGLDWFLSTVPNAKQTLITATEVFRNEPGSTAPC